MNQFNKIGVKLVLLALLAGIFYFAFSPGQMTPAFVVNHDKLFHFLVFFLLASILNYSFPSVKIYRQILYLLFFAIFIEAVQLIVVNRGFSIDDIIYDCLGFSLFYSLFLIRSFIKPAKIKQNAE